MILKQGTIESDVQEKEGGTSDLEKPIMCNVDEDNGNALMVTKASLEILL